jgi:hypothetical protein
MSEAERIARRNAGTEPWALWGPYLSERQWGTVREDFSPYGNAWEYFPHDHARSRTYRWGEDGLGGISDQKQRLCFALALWNGADPILKERLFGLTNSEGNHGEDVKEYYFYQDNTPTHSHMRMLYKYPHRAFPYGDLVAENARRKAVDPKAPEYELLDTGIFDEDRYHDVEIAYAKRGPTDILARITVTNRGPDAHEITLLPTLWFRNTWSWAEGSPKPALRMVGADVVEATHPTLGTMRLVAEGAERLLFCENETNVRRLFGADGPAHPKDAFHDFVVHGATDAVNPAGEGTKAAALYRRTLASGETLVLRLRLTDDATATTLGADFDAVFAARAAEADAFYDSVLPTDVTPDRRAIMRQAQAGMLWSKQFYHYVVEEWLKGDRYPAPPERATGRNAQWRHFYAEDVLSMPDKWEYPWFASWDMAFHTVVLAQTDPAFAKEQLRLLTREWYMSPTGQVPAYEWAFEDVNPPVGPWAAWEIYKRDLAKTGTPDVPFLERIFQRALMNFTWWVNRKDADNNNLFQGGFLGMDNIGVIDRTAAERQGFRLYQADATSWMGFSALNLMEIAIELAKHDKVYIEIAVKFLQHYLYIADAMNHLTRQTSGEVDLWDEQEGFYFDVALRNGEYQKLKVRSLVGLMPLLPVASIDIPALEDDFEDVFRDRLEWFLKRQPELLEQASETKDGHTSTILLSFLSEERLRRILAVMLDEAEFLSQHGIRSISQRHRDHPYALQVDGATLVDAYEPAESSSGMFGGNSNWRGPIWMPVNMLLVQSLRRYHEHYGDAFRIECPTGSGVMMTLDEVADEISRRLVSIFEPDAAGRRPLYGGTERFQSDPHWREHILFYEYFHGDNGAGIGASHQTGWTGLVSVLVEQLAERGRTGGA